MTNDSGTRSGVELREQRRERNAREIQQTAMSLFAERGYAAVTVEDIASEAGISERTFFRYFASKDHLLVAEAGRRIEVIHESLVGQDDGLDAWSALRNAVLDQSASEEQTRPQRGDLGPPHQGGARAAREDDHARCARGHPQHRGGAGPSPAACPRPTRSPT